MGAGFPSSKATAEVIKAQFAGVRAQIDLEQAIKLQRIEREIAAQEVQKQRADEQKKAREAQQKGKDKEEAATPPDFVQTGGLSAVGSGNAVQSSLDNASQAVGGSGAQQKLQELQAQRGAGGVAAPGGAGGFPSFPQPGPPSQAQALGQQGGGGAQLSAPDRRNTLSFQSQTGGQPARPQGSIPSLSQALGQPVNTLGLQSRSNALTQFDAQRLNQLDQAARFSRFNDLVEEFGAGLAAQADAAYSAEGVSGMARVLGGATSRTQRLDATNRRLVAAQIRAQDATARHRNAQVGFGLIPLAIRDFVHAHAVVTSDDPVPATWI